MAAPNDRSPDERIQMTVSERSAEAFAPALAHWLGDQLGTAEPPVITGVIFASSFANRGFSGNSVASS